MNALSPLPFAQPEPRTKRALLIVLTTVLAFSSGTSKAALQGRDLDGNSVIDAYYDTDLNITWLRNANVNGVMTWAAASSWAANFSFGGYSDWRLPTTSGDCTFIGCTGSEMGHLWYIELQNVANAPTVNTGGFQNFATSSIQHWSSEYAASSAVVFSTITGVQAVSNKLNPGFAMAVRDGDVLTSPSPVPEPGTYALMLAGLVGLALTKRSRAGRSKPELQLR